jgi:leucyl-tRNA synthetase
MEYRPDAIERHWQNYWSDNQVYKATEDANRPKFYVLDMFPYPSGAGLHVGHPLGYIASDIYARYKRHTGFSVLHPMGYDAFGLPAEQYAIQTGQHPATTTDANIARYRQQLDQLGFSFDWSRQVKTADPAYYQWTQWIFIQLFNAWFDVAQQRARPIAELIEHLQAQGTSGLNAAQNEERVLSAEQWNGLDEAAREAVLLNYRLAYRSESMVNWCPALGTVLANDEVKDGLSERGGHPVVQKRMMQWSLRISAYAQRLLDGLNTLDWSESIKESQRNWIGRSAGARVEFSIQNSSKKIEVFTTRPDTIFGVSFLVLAPEHPEVEALTTDPLRSTVNAYREQAARRSERERMADVKTVTGVFTGGYALHPFTGQPIPIWVADYVLAGYGTGAVMAVPGHDSRDYAFARHFDLPIVQVVDGPGAQLDLEAFEAKDGTAVNSDFLNGLGTPQAIESAIQAIESKGLGEGRVNYRLRDAIFGRQRYWGEPIPVYYDNGIAKVLPLNALPLSLPEVDKYLPTEDGEPPLARAADWTWNGHPLETTTMPGWAGSSWYYLRYMDPRNTKAPFSKESEHYWQQVDLYVGGSEHATGHLLYARFWHKVLHDLGHVSTQEPFQKLINQGMIQGMSAFVHRSKKDPNHFVSRGLANELEHTPLHVDVNLLQGDALPTAAFQQWRTEYAHATFELEGGQLLCTREVEKMSKSKYNVVTPDDIVAQYGADTLRMYEMFLGPIEQSKPWNTQGISGVHGFLKKTWRLYYGKEGLQVSEETASPEALKALHKAIKKVREDIEAFSLNTCVSTFMICVNQLTDLKAHQREILEPLAVLLSPFAPHLAEELWQNALGHRTTVNEAPYPEFREELLVENTFNYPVSFNGKTRFFAELPLGMDGKQVEEHIVADERTAKYLDGKTVKKVIVVPGRIVNVVVG